MFIDNVFHLFFYIIHSFNTVFLVATMYTASSCVVFWQFSFFMDIFRNFINVKERWYSCFNMKKQ